MDVQAEISIYPLRTESLSEPIDEFCKILRNNGLKVKTTSMSTLIRGDFVKVFNTCQKAFELIAEKYNIVMDFKISNACPKEAKKKAKKEQICQSKLHKHNSRI